MTTLSNKYLDYWRAQLHHQRRHGCFLGAFGQGGERQQPWTHCLECLKEHPRRDRGEGRAHDVKRQYAWAVPTSKALDAIHKHSPRGVVEIGAGGGYWAMLLRERGVDVVAYDPQPEPNEWHDRQWSEVLIGDHTSVIGHPDRTLLLCWPSYSETWTDEVVDLYDGDTVIYIGEGSGGCTGTDRMHALLGEETYCWHSGSECDCEKPEPKFQEVDSVAIPQWFGLHDELRIYTRRDPSTPPNGDHQP